VTHVPQVNFGAPLMLANGSVPRKSREAAGYGEDA